MRESNDQIAKLLRALHQNDDLVAEAFEAAVELGDRQRNNRIDNLANLKALKPQEEGVYRLNPRLREFIADYLVSYRAYQTLTRLSGSIHQARTIWREMRMREDGGDADDRNSLLEQFIDTVIDISYSIERNLSLLHALVSTQYGDVTSFQAKLRQNKYYINEISESLNEMAQVSNLFTEIESEALNAGMMEVRSVVRKRLTSRLLMWTSQIKDVQATINRSLFRARVLEQRVRKLSRVSHWLRQNKNSSGFEISLDGAPPELFRSEPIAVKAHIDVRDTSEAGRAALLHALRRLPPRPVPLPVEERPAPLAIIEEDVTPEPPSLEPHDVMLEALVGELRSTLGAISLRRWTEQQLEAVGLPVEDWLLYASIQLEEEGVPLTFVSDAGGTDRFANEISNDVIAQGVA
ncbi:hypothetical protein D9M68_223510 [compost metagenome]